MLYCAERNYELTNTADRFNADRESLEEELTKKFIDAAINSFEKVNKLKK